MKTITISIAAVLHIHSLQLALADQHIVVSHKEIDLKLSLAKFGPGHSLAFAAITDQCEKEIEQLNENSELHAAVEKMEACPSQIEQTDSSLNITTDFSTCSSLGDYQLACTAAGGKIVSVDSFGISCNATVMELSVEISIMAKNLPDCVGASCDGSIATDEEFQKEYKRELENALNFAGISGVCNITGSSGGESRGESRGESDGDISPASARILNKFTLLGGLAVFLMNLLC